MNAKSVVRQYERYVIPVYNRLGIVAVKAKGSWLWDARGKRYLDLFPGWGANALGHCHPRILAAIRDQAKKLIHVPNTFYHEPQARLAEALIRASFPGKVFFTNSGAESVEAAIKLARAYGAPDRWEIVCLEQSFHGRTMGALAATGQAKYRDGFAPMLPGFVHVPLNDWAAMEAAMGERTVAVMIELVQGEGGIHVADPEYVRRLRRLCDERRLLLIFDEISTGMGRTGTLFCFERYGVVPDLLLLAKPMAGGLPMGAMVARMHVSDVWKKSAHATTFGGNPLVAAAGYAALETIRKERLLLNVRRQARYLEKRLRQWKARFPIVREVRGLGFMWGIELDRPDLAAEWVKEALERGVLINRTQETVIRLYPALNIARKELEEGLDILEETLHRVEEKGRA